MLRPAVSDPVLIKPNEFAFLRSWNLDRDPYLPTDSSSEHLYSLYVSLSDANANDTKMPRSEREKRQRKLQFQLKRRNSVLMANFKEELTQPGGMRRSWSCVELGKVYCRETTQTKRVSFSVTVPPPAYPDIENTAYDLCPPKISARPILVRRNTTYSGKDNLVHMDFDSFIAWRRGSKMSDDVKPSRKQSKKEKEANPAKRKDSEDSKKDEMEHGDWWIVRIAKMGFESCFRRPRVNPSPPPSNDEIKMN
uniref:MSP domain-containing protein n=2 Tax=Caenorhabditis tropicalis TaxID=1561998 RepID=A0A1I7US94_9PELO